MPIGRHTVRYILVALLAATGLVGCREEMEPGAAPPGEEQTTESAALETGAEVIQDVTPVEQIEIHVVGFHPHKENPQTQMTSHHFCDQLNEDFTQCVLYDGNTEDANLHGIEYIISEALFERLPEEEKRYWHPHNYEILSGQLVAPGLPDAAEREFMENLINSYGKTWHVWQTGTHERPDDPLPLGDAHLAWSFNRDGEALPGLVEARDSAMDVDSREKRRERADLSRLANPQRGVDALEDAFPDAGGAPPGVAAEEADSAGRNPGADAAGDGARDGGTPEGV